MSETNDDVRRICRGCGRWIDEHSGPQCSPFPLGYSAQRPPPVSVALAWKNVCERAEAQAAAVARNGRHDEACIFDDGGKCVCGLDAARGRR